MDIGDSFGVIMKMIISWLVVLLVGIGSAQAVETEMPDKFKFTVGGYSIFRYESKIGLTDPNLGAGVFIDPQDTLGLDSSDQTVARLTGFYRFNERHSLDFSYYKISANGKKTLEDDLEWEDEDGNEIVIPVGAKVTSALDYEILKLGYLWSFHHTEKVEMAVGAGLHMTRINFDLKADTINGSDNADGARVTVPLPVVSFKINYSITPKLSWLFKTEVFGLKYGDITGTYNDTTLALEYRFVKNFGVGFGFAQNSLDVTEETDDQKFSFENKISGALLYASFHF